MNGYTNIREIGKRIRMSRKAKGFTQEQLAEKIDMSTNNLSFLECGNTGLSVPTLMELCRHLDVSSDYILFGTQQSSQFSPITTVLSELNEEQQLVAEQLLTVYANSCKKQDGVS